MFEGHFGLRENPFVSGHQSRFLFPSREHQEALAHLRYGIENREPFVLITGEVGTGKTTALYEALGEWKSQAVVALITNSALTRAELLEEICLRFNFIVQPPISKPQVMAQLERHLLALRARNERAILLLDEAQNLDRELLEEVRLLSNLETQGEKLLQVFLIGQPELEDRLTQPGLRQLRQRIAVHYRLNPLSVDDTQRYIQHRIAVAGGYAPDVFSEEACVEVHRFTHGIPREINQLCAKAMVAAFVEDSSIVLPIHVQSAAGETEFKSVLTEGGGLAEPSPPPSITPRTAASLVTPRPAPPIVTPPTSPAPPPPTWAPAAEPREPLHERPPASPRDPVEAQPIEPIEGPTWEAWVASLVKTNDAPEPSAAKSAPRAAQKPKSERRTKPREEPRVEPLKPEVATPRQAEITPLPLHPRRLEPPAAETEDDNDFGDPDQHEATTWRPPIWTPPAERASTAGLPPRLRQKLEQVELPEPSSNRGLRWMLLVGLMALIAIAATLLMRFAPWAKGTPRTSAVAGLSPTPPSNGATQAPASPNTAPTGPATLPSTTLERTPPVTSSAPPLAATTQRTPVSPTAVVATPPAAAARPSFGLSVGTFLNEERANVERDRIASATGLAARVVPVRQDGDTSYSIVIGAYPSRDAAERAASDLIQRGLVDEARVVSAGATPSP